MSTTTRRAQYVYAGVSDQYTVVTPEMVWPCRTLREAKEIASGLVRVESYQLATGDVGKPTQHDIMREWKQDGDQWATPHTQDVFIVAGVELCTEVAA